MVAVEFGLVGSIEDVADLEKLFDGVPVCLVKGLEVELDASLLRHDLRHRLEKVDALVLVRNVIANLGARVVADCQPKENVRDQLKVGLAEVLDADEPLVAQGLHHLREI